jgi:hypothetical protein
MGRRGRLPYTFIPMIMSSRPPRTMKHGWCWWDGRPCPLYRLAGEDARPTARRLAPPSYCHSNLQSNVPLAKVFLKLNNYRGVSSSTRKPKRIGRPVAAIIRRAQAALWRRLAQVETCGQRTGQFCQSQKRLFFCRGGLMCPPLTEGTHAGAPPTIPRLLIATRYREVQSPPGI